MKKLFWALIIFFFLILAENSIGQRALAEDHVDCPGAQVKGISSSSNTVTYTAPDNNVVTGVCIKSGNNMFTGSTYNLSTELGNGTYENGCYTVSGVNTQTVTVTQNAEASSCQQISHVDVFFQTPTPTPTAIPPTPATPLTTATPTLEPTSDPVSRIESITTTPTPVIFTPAPSPTLLPLILTPTPTLDPSPTLTPSSTPVSSNNSSSNSDQTNTNSSTTSNSSSSNTNSNSTNSSSQNTSSGLTPTPIFIVTPNVIFKTQGQILGTGIRIGIGGGPMKNLPITGVNDWLFTFFFSFFSGLGFLIYGLKLKFSHFFKNFISRLKTTTQFLGRGFQLIVFSQNAKSETKNHNTRSGLWFFILKYRQNLAIILSIILLTFSFANLFKIYYPIAANEYNYQFNKKNLQPNTPIYNNFMVIIPKLGINSPVFANIDPYNKDIYQNILTKGIAHAKDTSLPGQPGNIFLFAHSSTKDIPNQYNSIFYLLGKLEKEDKILLKYGPGNFRYKVSDKKIVNASDSKYLINNNTKETLTLMTCWPPGTALKRLLIFAEKDLLI